MANIFLQIASYRDPELGPTIHDCLQRAKYPHDLTFGICWQRDELEHLPVPQGDRRFRIDDVPWWESEGVCWARSRVQKLYDGEPFTLQLDSHHRFARDWDVALLRMVEETGSPKPIISTYATAYRPNRSHIRALEGRDTRLYKMVADYFTPEGALLFKPHFAQPGNRPAQARFVSGHYFFTVGSFCEEYKYDPEIYFAGEEISMSLRSFTLGYDLFRPHRTVLWHEYTREGRRKHWDDHTGDMREHGRIELAWHERNDRSMRRLRQLLGQVDSGMDLGEFGLGSVRSRRDYEQYAGIDFRDRRLHPHTTAGHDPPNPDRSWQMT